MVAENTGATFRTPAGAAIARKRKLPTNKGKYKQGGSKTPVVNYKKFIRACKNCINLLIDVIRTGNFLNFISNFFLFRETFEQLLCFLASNFLVLASNFLGFYEHNRAMPTRFLRP